ncbi:MAG: OB-fold nucleic acid binding domain-containing protein, partial [bacterium]|nr:OB-fold nucleic acid binding domain-containing protein [bacterium]
MTGEEQVRRERLQRLKQQGVNPYPAEAARTCSISAFLHAFDARMKDSAQVSLAGRIRAIRKHGGLSFVRLQDESGESQIVLKRDDLGEEAYNAFHEMGDIGDFYSFTGTTFL